MENVFKEIREERAAQDLKWGGATHDDSHLELEWAQFMLKRLHIVASYDSVAPAVVRTALIELAALVVACLESHDRKYGSSSEETV